MGPLERCDRQSGFRFYDYDEKIDLGKNHVVLNGLN